MAPAGPPAAATAGGESRSGEDGGSGGGEGGGPAPTARDGGASVDGAAVAAAAAAGAAAATAPAPAPAGQPDATAFVQAIHTGIRHLFKRYTFYNSVVVVTTSCGTNLICLYWRKNHVPCRPTA